MSTKQDKEQIKHLKNKVNTAVRASDVRLLKLTMVMVILAIISVVMHGRLQIW